MDLSNFNVYEEVNKIDFFNIPDCLNKKMTEEEFKKIMATSNSDISIEDVEFIDYPNILKRFKR